MAETTTELFEKAVRLHSRRLLAIARAIVGPAAAEDVLQQMIEQVRKAIARLPEHFRAALVLCEYEEMSYVQIAEVLDASVPQIKTWLHRGRRQLAEKLKA